MLLTSKQEDQIREDLIKSYDSLKSGFGSPDNELTKMFGYFIGLYPLKKQNISFYSSPTLTVVIAQYKSDQPGNVSGSAILATYVQGVSGNPIAHLPIVDFAMFCLGSFIATEWFALSRTVALWIDLLKGIPVESIPLLETASRISIANPHDISVSCSVGLSIDGLGTNPQAIYSAETPIRDVKGFFDRPEYMTHVLGKAISDCYSCNSPIAIGCALSRLLYSKLIKVE